MTLHIKFREQLGKGASQAAAACARDVGQLIRVALDFRLLHRYTAPYVEGRGAVPVGRMRPRRGSGSLERMLLVISDCCSG